MSRAIGWKWMVWVFLFLLGLLQQQNLASARRYEKCSTKDGRQGVCVVKKYCREAFENSDNFKFCGNPQAQIFCCPVPTMRSAVNRSPFSVSTQELGISSTATLHMKSTPSPSRSRPPSPRTGIADSRNPDSRNPETRTPTDEESRDPYRRPEDGYQTKENPRETHDSRSSNSSSTRTESRRRNINDGVKEQGRRPSTTSETHRSDLEHPRFRPNLPNRPVNRPSDPSQTTIRFPGSYETSLPHPTVPACGVKPYDLFIAGGEETKEHEWPWMVAIFRRNQNKANTFLCGGSLINSRYILTAAHCLVHNYVILPASSFVVRLGSHYLDSGEDYTVGNIIVHHNHSGSDFFNDIALMRLASEVYITDKIATICLPYADMVRESFVGRIGTVTGWGDTSFRESGTRVLHEVKVPIVSNEQCSAAYSRVRGAAFLARGTDHVVCAGLQEGGRDACPGDSGGPLMIKDSSDKWIIVGVVSLGYKCAEPGYPGVYTRITHYLDWIYTNMKK